MPLAIELAASRLRSLSFTDLAARLNHQLAVLTRQRPAVGDDPRHQTMRATLDWSYDLLNDDQRRLARGVSVFAGGFRLDAVEALFGVDIDVLDGVDELVAKSLLTFDGTTARYRLLELIRQYLAERLDSSGTDEAAGRAHVEWVASLCAHLGSQLLEDQPACSRRLDEESGNVDIALRWALDHGEHDIAVRIFGSLGLYWWTSDMRSGRHWCHEVLEASVSVGARDRADALTSAGVVAQGERVFDRSISWLREAVSIYRSERATAGEATALAWLGRGLLFRWEAHHNPTDASDATASLMEALRLSTQVDDLITASWGRIYLSQQAVWAGDLEGAGRLCQRVVDECTCRGARYPVGEALRNLALIAERRGRHDEALDHLREATALYRSSGDPFQLAVTLQQLVVLAAPAGRGVEGLTALAESARLLERIGRSTLLASTLGAAAVAYSKRGQTQAALEAMASFDADPGNHMLTPLVTDAVAATRARLDHAALETITISVRGRAIDELIEQLILQPGDAEH